MYRFLEILPGALSWATLILMVFLSWYWPAFAAVFIILFDIYWLLKTIYLSLHLSSSFSVMKKNLKVNWLRELDRDANNANAIRMPRIVEKELSYQLNGILFSVHNKLGRFCRERQYGDALAEELKKKGLKFERELPVEVAGRKSNFVDFLIEGKIAIELKAKHFIEKDDYYQLQRYLQTAGLKLGFIVNFRDRHLKPRRVLNSGIEQPVSFVDSHGFADSHRVSWRDIYHLIIFPMYREPYAVVRESFASLAKGNYPLDKFIVVLATEERALRPGSGQATSTSPSAVSSGPNGSGQAGQAGDVAETAEKIEREFGGKFFKFLITAHPANLPDEIPGKGSNETWAAKEAKRLIIDPMVDTQTNADYAQTDAENEFSQRKSALRYENILVSVFDIDTQIFPEYFGRLTHVFLKSENRLRAIYQPIPLFTNNVYQAPALARVISFSSTFWQMMQQSRPERLTSFSSQSIPLTALMDIGFWHTDVVSEDSRSFWQCYLRYHGDFRVEPLFYPVSMDTNAAPTFWGTLKNNYKQHRRWAWGCENIPYLLCGKRDADNPNSRSSTNSESIAHDTTIKPQLWVNSSNERRIRKFAKNSLFDDGDGLLRDKKIPLRKKLYWSFNTIEGFHSWATNALMIFALGWLPVVLGGRDFNISLLSYSLPSVARFIIELSMVGVASTAFLSILLLPPRYAESREGESRPEPLRWHEYILHAAQWLLIPVTLIVFGCVPALESQTRMMLGGKWRLGFWVTPKTRSENRRKLIPAKQKEISAS